MNSEEMLSEKQELIISQIIIELENSLFCLNQNREIAEIDENEVIEVFV